MWMIISGRCVCPSASVTYNLGVEIDMFNKTRRFHDVAQLRCSPRPRTLLLRNADDKALVSRSIAPAVRQDLWRLFAERSIHHACDPLRFARPSSAGASRFLLHRSQCGRAPCFAPAVSVRFPAATGSFFGGTLPFTFTRISLGTLGLSQLRFEIRQLLAEIPFPPAYGIAQQPR